MPANHRQLGRLWPRGLGRFSGGWGVWGDSYFLPGRVVWVPTMSSNSLVERKSSVLTQEGTISGCLPGCGGMAEGPWICGCGLLPKGREGRASQSLLLPLHPLPTQEPVSVAATARNASQGSWDGVGGGACLRLHGRQQPGASP